MSNPNMRRLKTVLAIVALSVASVLATTPAHAQPSSHTGVMDARTGAGFYFPAAGSTDTPEIRFPKMEGVGPQQRQAFVDQLNVMTTSSERSIPIIAQAVGEDRKTLVLTNIETNEFMTPYIARAMLARLTSMTRFLPAVTEMGLSAEFDIYNMGAVLGFERIIITDGRGFAHEARLQTH